MNRRTACALALLTVLSGCQDQFLATSGPVPTAASANGPAVFNEGAGFNYSADALLLPDGLGGHSMSTDLGMPRAPASGWVQVTLGGHINIQQNPVLTAECERWKRETGRDLGLCPMPLAGAQAPPEGVFRCRLTPPGGCGQTLFIEWICSSTGCVSPYLVRGSVAPGNTVFLREGYKVRIQRRGESEPWGFGNSNNNGYIFSGAHSVNVQSVPQPFGIQAADDQYTAADPTKPILLTTDAANVVRWRFVAGDTGANPSYPSSLDEAMTHPECNGRKQCLFQPDVDGRVYVFGASASSGRGWVASPIVRVNEQRIEVTCPEQIERGQPIVCTVTARPGGTLTTIEWTFTSGTGIEIRETDIHVWNGIMALGGQISVNAMLNGERLTDEATVIVTDRGWNGRVPYPSELPTITIDPTRFPQSPVVVNAQGYDTWPNGGLGVYRWGIEFFGKFIPIASGPNAGLWYFPEPPSWLTPRVFLSGHLEAGHPFYEAQTGRRLGEPPPPSGYTHWCTKADMDILRREVTDHEGATSGTRLSHHAFNISYASANDPGPVMDRVVFPTPTGDFIPAAEAALGAAYENAMEAANVAAVHAQSNTYTLPCKVHLP